MGAIRITIDKIVLSELGLTADRAEHLRGMIEYELSRILTQEGLPPGMTEMKVEKTEAPKSDFSGPVSDMFLAGSVARSIADSLKKTRG